MPSISTVPTVAVADPAVTVRPSASLLVLVDVCAIAEAASHVVSHVAFTAMLVVGLMKTSRESLSKNHTERIAQERHY